MPLSPLHSQTVGSTFFRNVRNNSPVHTA